MQHLQDIIEEKAAREAEKKISDLFYAFERSVPAVFGFMKVKLFHDRNPIEVSADAVFRALREASVAYAIPKAQEQAAKDFIAKVERLSSEIEDLQSQIS